MTPNELNGRNFEKITPDPIQICKLIVAANETPFESNATPQTTLEMTSLTSN